MPSGISSSPAVTAIESSYSVGRYTYRHQLCTKIRIYQVCLENFYTPRKFGLLSFQSKSKSIEHLHKLPFIVRSYLRVTRYYYPYEYHLSGPMTRRVNNNTIYYALRWRLFCGSSVYVRCRCRANTVTR